MTTEFIDIHPHIIAKDESKYPTSPLFGKQSGWSKDHPVAAEGLIAAMDEAGVGKAAIVQASTCYGHDNSYVCDAVKACPERFTAVCSVDAVASDAPEITKGWMALGMSGLRLFTGGSTAAYDHNRMDDPRSFPVWDLCGAEGVPICIQTNAGGLPHVAGLAKRFPEVKIILDHLARPEIEDGPPYLKAGSLFAMSAFENIYLKITPRTSDAITASEAADPQSFFTKLIAAFGPDRLAWGSNYPSSEGTMRNNLEMLKVMLAFLDQETRTQIFARTAQSLYPALKDVNMQAAVQ